ncbi:DUF29 domain-containing protein [Acaryochloris sp. IP29b_bin.137]|uniref:DUF29 domain-containing protein n=1 Tax=Acaryochloris sp. IP29b_bin.137 TaxID=2969217 RepID=UPI0026134387|nr:DUF29 domain-containing protein [Acaryochloris sp. IP29b_bin.137]
MQIPNPTTAQTLYEVDFIGWVEQTSQLLRQGNFREVDIEHLVEEIESLGKRDRRELTSRLIVLVSHLLKWQYQPGKQSNSWRCTIYEQRRQIQLILEDSPSLRRYLMEQLPKGYNAAIKQAALETDLPLQTFPVDCPYTGEEICSEGFFPGASR